MSYSFAQLFELPWEEGGLSQRSPRPLLPPRRQAVATLRRFREIPPVSRAYSKIINGVVGMPLTVLPPDELKGDEESLELARHIKSSLLNPNDSLVACTWSSFVWQIVEDMLTHGQAIVEKLPPEEDVPFRLYAVNAGMVRINPKWDDRNPLDSPCFIDISLGQSRAKALYRDEAFLIRQRSTTYELNPPSPLEVAFELLASWLGISRLQQDTATDTTGSPRNLITVVGEEGVLLEKGDLAQFQSRFRNPPDASGAIVVSGNVNNIPLKPQDDRGMFLEYTDTVLRALGMALNMSPRDLNVVESDNRATAGVAADSTWQDAILPVARVIIEAINREVVDFFYPGFRLELSDKEPRGEAEEAKTALELYQGGGITLNEMRRRIGADPLGKEGDAFLGSCCEPHNQPVDQEKTVKEKETAAIAVPSQKQSSGDPSPPRQLSLWEQLLPP